MCFAVSEYFIELSVRQTIEQTIISTKTEEGIGHSNENSSLSNLYKNDCTEKLSVLSQNFFAVKFSFIYLTKSSKVPQNQNRLLMKLL